MGLMGVMWAGALWVLHAEAGHALAQAAFLQEVLLQAAWLLVEQVS
jgi:hypothetical protein